MAARLTPEQISEVIDALSSCKTAGVHAVINALSQSKQSAFTADEIGTMTAGISAMERPLEEKAAWTAAEKRGLFFVFEGLDRSGKSTQSKLLAKQLEEAGPVKWMCFPNRTTPTGALIDLYLQKKIDLHDEAVHLLFSANRWETAQQIVEDLNQGTSIVCDRYAFSGVAYSAAKGLDLQWCQAPDRGLPTPDGIFFLHIAEKVGAARANFGDERYENAQMQSQVRIEFTQPLIREGVAWHDVDGARDIEVIREEIRNAVEELRKKCATAEGAWPIKRLWVS